MVANACSTVPGSTAGSPVNHGVTVVGGGLAGLVAAIECAEAGATVTLFEAHSLLGGRARSTDGPFVANLGPHALYDDGATWKWLAARNLVGRARRSPIGGLTFRVGGQRHVLPPARLLRMFTVHRDTAPIDIAFKAWAAQRWGHETATLASHAAGVFTFDADPGRLSAAFVLPRLRRVMNLPPHNRYVVGGWGMLVRRLEDRARALGVYIHTGSRVDAVPDPPVIVATELDTARRLLGDESLAWEGTRTAFLDVGVKERRRDPFVVWDLDEAGWAERYSRPDPSLAPAGHSVIQAQVGLRPGESLDDGVERIGALLDCGFPHWREREAWRRRYVLDGRSGALDLPGTSWQDRPAVERGDGVFLCGDAVAAPGLLSEVAVTSAVRAAAGTIAYLSAPGARHGPAGTAAATP
ncbi:MAG: FAD-dependent oxidoreductase [Nocardioides sp.]